MNTGIELMTLKQATRTANVAVEERRMTHAGWFLVAWLLAFIAVFFGFALSLTGVCIIFGVYPNVTRVEGAMLLAGGVATWAFSYLGFSVPSIWDSRDTELNRLRTVVTETHSAYDEALKNEMTSYGIDTDSITSRTNYMTDNYEFTALRNEEPIDVTVREFQNEIVFMMNGERLKKPVTA